MKDKFLNSLRTVAQGVKNSLCNWYQRSNDKWNQEQQQKIQNELQMQKQYLDSCIYSIMCQIADELLPVLQGRTFFNLCPIHSAADIRIKDYRPYNGAYIYCFEVAKQTDSPYAFSVLESIRNKIQTDIRRHQQELIAVYGYGYAECLHPFIYNGLYIMKIADAGTDIRLYIASNYLPC